MRGEYEVCHTADRLEFGSISIRISDWYIKNNFCSAYLSLGYFNTLAINHLNEEDKDSYMAGKEDFGIKEIEAF